jgi:hypothetical protein
MKKFWKKWRMTAMVLGLVAVLTSASIILLLWMVDLLSTHYYIFWALLKALK